MLDETGFYFIKRSVRRVLREILAEESRGRNEYVQRLTAGPHRVGNAVGGFVITRGRPGTASGSIFLTLEDDTGVSNIVFWPKTFEKHRKGVMTGRLLKITGKLQREGISHM